MSSQKVGRYRLLAPIASGGTATVYLGRSEAIGGFSRLVAVKLLHPHLLQDSSSEASKEFLEEAKLSARMQHPLIVPVLDVGESEQGFYLVMEYVDGASLAELLQLNRNLPQRIIGRILVDVLEALHAAHTAVDEKGMPLGIVHRDFSPQNILVGSDGRSRLTDFGIAKATSRAEYTRTGLIKGKIAYMSPEQAEGTVLDQRSDVWAAGVVAWEMLAGQRMYPKLDPLPHLLRIINREAPSLREAKPEIPQDLIDAVHSALVRSPEGRTASAAELSSKLCAAFGGSEELAAHAEVGQYLESFGLERLSSLRTIVQEAGNEEQSTPHSRVQQRRQESTTVRHSTPRLSSPDGFVIATKASSALGARTQPKFPQQWGVVLAALALPALFLALRWSGPTHEPAVLGEEFLPQAETTTLPASTMPSPPEGAEELQIESEGTDAALRVATAETKPVTPAPLAPAPAALPSTPAQINAARTIANSPAKPAARKSSPLAPSPY